METILHILQMISFLAFIVGMFSAKTVRCSSRGKVALIYLGLFFIISIITETLDTRKPGFLSLSRSKMEKSEKLEVASKEIPELEKGDKYTIKSNNGKIEITFSNIKIRKTPKGALNLVFRLRVKNDTGKCFKDYHSILKLIDSSGVELDEANIYVPGANVEYQWSMISVKPYSEEEEKVGYNVKKDATYYLSLHGEIVAKVTVNEYVK